MDLAPRRRPSTEETCEVEETGDVSPDSPPPDVYPTSDVCVWWVCRMSTSYNYSKVIPDPEPMGSFYYETDE